MMDSRTVDKFIQEQKSEWPLAERNFDALAGVRVREVELPGGWTVKVQFNPARIVSSGAKVDAKTIRERKCFLCRENRPAEQRGLEYGRYTILVNPFPIFPRHLTVPDRSHTLQLIDGRIADMARLALDLDEYVVFYNGPRCGASAPDHMHFQAGNADFLTLPAAIEDSTLETLAEDGDNALYLAADLPLRTFVIDADSPEKAQELFVRLYAAMPVPEGQQEPMMNILAYALPDGQVRLVVIPRKRHRPACYGTEGPGTMLLSPASVDLGGVFITPLEKDFEALDADKIISILDELCLSDSEIRQIADNVK